MTATTNNQWMHQFYNKQQQQQQPLMEGSSSSFSDSTVITTTTTTTSTHHHHHLNNIMMQSSSLSSSERMMNILSPKGGNNVSKPIRRRSRASKRTPTTLLNANTTNFRALVQQFTGCPNTTTTSSSSSLIGVHKGPITLNFQQGTNIGTTRGYSYDDQVHHDHQQNVAAPIIPIWQSQEQSGGYSFDPNQGNIMRNNSMHVSDGLVMDNDFSLHHLTVNASPNHAYYRNQ